MVGSRITPEIGVNGPYPNSPPTVRRSKSPPRVPDALPGRAASHQVHLIGPGRAATARLYFGPIEGAGARIWVAKRDSTVAAGGYGGKVGHGAGKGAGRFR